MFFKTTTAVSSLLMFASTGFGSVCETKTYNGVTENGSQCQVELDTKVRAAQGGGSNSTCVANRSLEGRFQVEIDGRLVTESFDSNAKFAGNSIRPTYNQQRTEGYKYDDVIVVNSDSISVEKNVEVFEATVIQNIGYTTTRFGAKIGEETTFAQSCFF